MHASANKLTPLTHPPNKRNITLMSVALEPNVEHCFRFGCFLVSFCAGHSMLKGSLIHSRPPLQVACYVFEFLWYMSFSATTEKMVIKIIAILAM